MENFIYVFTKEERDALLASGYVLLRNDEKRNMYTFVNKGREDFVLSDKMQYALSDTLTF